MTAVLTREFNRIGVRAVLRPWPAAPTAVRSRYRGVVVDVAEDDRGAHYVVSYDPSSVRLDVLDVDPARRRLLLAVRYLDGSAIHGVVCGHDVHGWYVVAVGPCGSASTLEELGFVSI